MANIALSGSIIATSTIVQRQAQCSLPITFPLAFNIPNLTNRLSGSATVTAIATLAGRLINIIPISGNVSVTTSLQGNVKNALALQNTGLIGSATISLTSITSRVVLGSQVSSESAVANVVILNTQRVASLITSLSTISAHAIVNGVITGTIFAVSGLLPSIIVGNFALSAEEGTTNEYVYPTFNTSATTGGWSHWGQAGAVGAYGQTTDPNFIHGNQMYSHWVTNSSGATGNYLLYQSPAFIGGSRALSAVICMDDKSDVTNAKIYPVWNAASGGTPSGAWTSIERIDGGYFFLCKCENIKQNGSNDLVGMYVRAGCKAYLSQTQLEQKPYATSFTVGTRTEGRVLSSSDITAIIKGSLALVGSIRSISSLVAAALNIVVVSSSVSGGSTISGTVKINFVIASSLFAISSLPPPIVTTKVALNGQISASFTIIAQIANEMGSVLQLIAANSTISGNPTATFILGANNVANTWLTGIIADQVNIQGNVTGSLSLTANIVKNVSISSSAIGAISSINATISASLGATGMVYNSTDVNATVIIQQSIQASLVSTSNLTAGKFYSLIGSSLSLESNITIPQTFILPWSFPFVINDLVKSTAAISGTVTAVSSMTNNGIVRTIAAALQATSSITGKLTCTFPPRGAVSSSSVIGPSSITSKLALNGQLPATPAMTGQVMGQVNVTSQPIAAISTVSGTLTVSFAPTTNVLANTSIVGSIAKQQNVQGSVVVSSSLTAIMEQVAALVIAIQATVSISDVSITVTIPLSIGFLSNSSINGTIGNAIGIAGQVIADSTLQATLKKVYLITLKATFSPIVSATVMAPFNNSVTALFTNLLSAVLLQPTILESGEMQSNQQIRGIFDCEQTLKVVPYEVSATAVMNQGVPEIVIFEVNIDSSRVLNLSQFSNSQFVNVSIIVKF